jgi:hypothetical protein
MQDRPRQAETNRIATYREFWPFYLREHSRPLTRAIHIVGTGLALAALAAALVTNAFWFALVAPLLGYGPAWSAHLFVEGNRPVTFRYPLWSLVSDFRMAGLWLVGGLSAELARAGVSRGGSTTR